MYLLFVIQISIVSEKLPIFCFYRTETVKITFLYPYHKTLFKITCQLWSKASVCQEMTFTIIVKATININMIQLNRGTGMRFAKLYYHSFILQQIFFIGKLPILK